MSEKKQKTKKKFSWKGFIFLILLLYLIGMFAYYVLTMPIKNIVIKNNNLVTESEIIKTLKIDEKTPIIKANILTMKKRLKKNVLIEDVKVHKDLFGTLTLTITENRILFLNILNNKLVLSNGKTIEPNEKYLGYPTLVNYVPSEVYSKFIKGLKKVDTKIFALISEIEYSPDKAGEVVLDDTRFLLLMNDGNKIYINNANLDKINEYQSILASLTEVGTLYLDSNSENFIFNTRAKEEAKKKAEEEKQKEQNGEENVDIQEQNPEEVNNEN